VTRNTIIADDSWGVGGIEISNGGPFTSPTNITVADNNLISQRTSSGGIGIWCDVAGNHITFTRNRILGNWSLGAKDEAGCYDNTFSYNVFSGDLTGICNCSGTGNPGQYGEIVNGNVFYNMGWNAYCSNNTTAVTMQNNIYYLNGTGSSGQQM